MAKVHNPAGIMTPPTYHHGVEVSGPVRTLYISGQVGSRKDGTAPDGIAAQTELVYANLKAILTEAGMEMSDIVKTTAFLLKPEDRAGFAGVRDTAMGGHKCASTLVYVAGLAQPAWLVEVEAIAVKPI